MSPAPEAQGGCEDQEVPQPIEVSVGAQFRAKQAMRLVDVQKTNGGYETRYVEINAGDVIAIEALEIYPLLGSQQGEGEPYVKMNLRERRYWFKASTLKSADWEKLAA